MLGDVVRFDENARDEPTLDQATAVLHRLLPHVGRVTDIRPLHGGSINRVSLWQTTGKPASVVVKLHDGAHVAGFRREAGALGYLRRHTRLPVPRPLAVLENEPEGFGSGLILEHIPAAPLSATRLTSRGREHLQRSLADHLVELHGHRSATFGRLGDDSGTGREAWIDVFRPMIEGEAKAVRDRLPAQARRAVDRVLSTLARRIPGEVPPEPTLVHGDLWANNLLVDDAHPDRPVIRGFIDPAAAWADPEYELAYLRVFDTATDDFFKRYASSHPLRPGFDARCRVYWLHTLLLHLRVHGEQYLDSTNKLAMETARL